MLVFDELDRLLLMNEAAEGLLGEADVETLAATASAIGVHDLAALDTSRSEMALGATGRWLEVALYRVPVWRSIPGAGERRSHENRASSIVVLRDVTAARTAREARERSSASCRTNCARR